MKYRLIQARELRKNMTLAERILWQHLRLKKINGMTFRRQHIIGPYITDFVSLKASLVIECDGSQHNESEADITRDAYIRSKGFKVLRFWNNDILNNTDSVVSAIRKEIIV